MATVKLDRKEIESKIEAGNNCNGGYVLAVAPDGSDHKIHWMETNRQWDPWPAGWMTIGIPPLNPEGEGAEWERAKELMKDQLPNADEPHDADYVEEKLYQADVSIVTYVEDHFPNEWKAYNEEAVDWLADAFLQACNGDGNDLNDPTPWGHASEYEGYDPIIAPPAEFEWA